MTGKYYIKERYNPQLGTYYVCCGQLTVKQAKAKERSLYGDNIMRKFETEEEYKTRIMLLKAQGELIK